MEVQYSRPGIELYVYAVSLSFGGQWQRFLRKNPINLFALLQMLLLWVYTKYTLILDSLCVFTTLHNTTYNCNYHLF